MAVDEPMAFTITQGKIAFVLSMITLLGMIFGGVWSYAQQDFEIRALKEGQASLVVEVGRLAESVDQLTLALREVQVIQKVKP